MSFWEELAAAWKGTFSRKQYLHDGMVLIGCSFLEMIMTAIFFVVIRLFGFSVDTSIICSFLFCLLLDFCCWLFFPPRKEMRKRGIGVPKKKGGLETWTNKKGPWRHSSES